MCLIQIEIVKVEPILNETYLNKKTSGLFLYRSVSDSNMFHFILAPLFLIKLSSTIIFSAPKFCDYSNGLLCFKTKLKQIVLVFLLQI